MTTRRPWLVPAVAAIAAVALFLVGAVAWDMTASVKMPRCPPNSFCFNPYPGDHHLHPLRAELLWAASGVFALVAVAGRVRERRRPASPAQSAGG